jgi:hypothetical protein
MSIRSLALAFPLVALSLVACGPAEAPGPAASTGVAEEAIKGGYTDTTDVNVVGIYDSSAGALCTGSLIAPNLVLTAHHCVAPVLNEVNGGVSCSVTKFGKPNSAYGFYVTTKGELSQNMGDYHTVHSVEVPPVSGSAAFCGYDAAALILSKPIDMAEAAPLVPRVDTVLQPKEQYYAVGYGATDGQGSGAGTRRRLDNLFIDCVGEGCADYVPTYLRKQEFIGDKGTCEGDSGGPAFDMQHRVVGITSRGDANCQMSIYTQVYGWADWIKSLGVKAAQAGGYDPPPWATGWPTDPAFSGQPGATCNADTDCPAAKCIVGGPNGNYCTRRCDAATPCPDGYQCDAGAGVCLQIPPPDPTPGTGGGSPGAGGGDATSTPKSSVPKQPMPVFEQTTCAVAIVGADPTKPDPWFAGAVAAIALAASRRRSKRAR